MPTRPLAATWPTAARPTPARPELPSWFRAATICVYAVCTGLAAILTVLALTVALTSARPALVDVTVTMLAPFMWLSVLGAGAWCHTVAHTRRIDPTTPHLNAVWFIAAWFVPVVHVFVPHRMFGDLWASAKWQQSDRRGSNTPLAPRPWIISMWAFAWGLLFAWAVVAAFFPDTFFRDGRTILLVGLGLMAASSGLLVGVIRTIAGELNDHRRRGTGVIP